MNDPSKQKQVADATGVLALLQGQADTVRSELLGLRQQLTQVERDFAARRGAELMEANEQLVLAAIRAQEIADAARSKLDELLASAIPAPDGRDLREANEQLVLATLSAKEREATAQDAYKRQIAFLATVAHELRNPLMPLRLATHMLSRARTDEAGHNKLQATISGQVAQITRLINDLLDGSRISTGKLRLERTVVDLSDIIDLAVETSRPAMKARNHRFSTVMPSGGIKVLGDPARLTQVLGNLLGNACKYTLEGGEITLQAAVTGDAVSITIADNGIGISAAALPHVFDLFVQDARASQLSPGGLGIGLAVVRELVTAHEGQVVARSAGPDLGSQFVVTLPLVAASLNGPM